jgi:hypothetical protein
LIAENFLLVHLNLVCYLIKKDIHIVGKKIKPMYSMYVEVAVRVYVFLLPVIPSQKCRELLQAPFLVLDRDLK